MVTLLLLNGKSKAVATFTQQNKFLKNGSNILINHHQAFLQMYKRGRKQNYNNSQCQLKMSCCLTLVPVPDNGLLQY
jgi:hypothetical protein